MTIRRLGFLLKQPDVRENVSRHHGFYNDTTPRYDAESAKLAWERTLTFFKTNLK